MTILIVVIRELQYIEQLESVRCHVQVMLVLLQTSNHFEENHKYSY